MISFIAVYNTYIEQKIKVPYWLYYFDDTDEEYKDFITDSWERWYAYNINLNLFKKENLIKTYEEYQNVLEKYSLQDDESNIKCYINLTYYDTRWSRSRKSYKWYVYNEWMIKDRKKFFEEVTMFQYSLYLFKNPETVKEVLKYFNMPTSWNILWEFKVNSVEIDNWYDYETIDVYTYEVYSYWFKKSWNFFIKKSSTQELPEDQYKQYSEWYDSAIHENFLDYVWEKIAKEKWYLYNARFFDYFIHICYSLLDEWKKYYDENEKRELRYYFEDINLNKKPSFHSEHFFDFERNKNNYLFEYKDWKFCVTSKFDNKDFENCVEEISDIWRKNDGCFWFRHINPYNKISINVFKREFIYDSYNVSEIYKKINEVLSKYDNEIQTRMKSYFQKSMSMILVFKNIFENIEKHLIQIKRLAYWWTYYYEYWINLQKFWYKMWYDTVYWLWRTADQERKEPFTVEDLKRWSLDSDNWSCYIKPEHFWDIDKENFIEYSLHNKLHSSYESDFKLCSLRLELTWIQKEEISKAQKNIDIQTYLEAIRDKDEDYWQFVSVIVRWSLTELTVEDFKTHFQWKLTNYELSEIFKCSKDNLELKKYVYTLIPQSYKDFKELDMFK